MAAENAKALAQNEHSHIEKLLGHACYMSDQEFVTTPLDENSPIKKFHALGILFGHERFNRNLHRYASMTNYRRDMEDHKLYLIAATYLVGLADERASLPASLEFADFHDQVFI